MDKEKYKKYVKKLSNEKLIEEYNHEVSPYSIHKMDWDYEYLHIVYNELLDRLNKLDRFIKAI